MRLQLTLEHRNNSGLPINYQYFISSWIYHTLGRANPEFATWLHEQGYGYGGKQYKLFTFSQLMPQRYDIDKQQGLFICQQSPTTLILSFHLNEAFQHFVVGLFNDQKFSLGNRDFQVDFSIQSVETLPKPVFTNTTRFHLQKPLCISRDEMGKAQAQYKSPEDSGYPELLFQNLLRKKQALENTTDNPKSSISFKDLNFKLLSEPKSQLLHIKNQKIRGYLFDFEMTAPIELLELGYYGGFGEKNSSLGMGMTTIF